MEVVGVRKLEELARCDQRRVRGIVIALVKCKNLTCGDSAATEWRTTEVLQESGGALLTLSNVPAFLEDVDCFGSAAKKADAGANPQALICMTERECCWL
jgi:hypothetical protein